MGELDLVSRVRGLALEVSRDLESVLGHQIDLCRISFCESDANFRVISELQEKIIQESNRDDWRDKVESFFPKALLSKMLLKIYSYLFNKTMMMVYEGDGKFAVNPSLLSKEDDFLKRWLAHELVHANDDKLYGIYDKMQVHKERLFNIALLRTELKHTLGFVRGYLLDTLWTRDYRLEELQELSRLNKINGDNLMRIIEGHAEYMANQYMINQLQNGVKKPFPFTKVVLALSLLPLYLILQVIPPFREKFKQYYSPKRLIDLAYKNSIPIGAIYINPPSKVELSNPQIYFESIGFPIK